MKNLILVLLIVVLNSQNIFAKTCKYEPKTEQAITCVCRGKIGTIVKGSYRNHRYGDSEPDYCKPKTPLKAKKYCQKHCKNGVAETICEDGCEAKIFTKYK